LRRDLQVRTTAILLGLFTVAAIIFAWLNFQQERKLAIPNDGIWWVEDEGHLKAERVHPQGPGERAGVKPGDALMSVNGSPITKTADLIRQLYKKGVYAEVKYELRRDRVPLEVQLVLVPADTSLNLGLRLIALTYLSIGFFVLLRRWTAPKSLHFYIFCLVSFVFYAFKYTGKFNAFDWIVYWSNVVAWLLQPALFLHFALTFPEEREFLKKNHWASFLVYLPGALLLCIHLFAFRNLEATGLLLFRLDQMEWTYLVLFFAISAVILWQSYERADTPLLRQQMKWVTRGTVLAIAPFTIFYVVPTLLGDIPTPGMKLSVLSLIFLPLTFGYAIVRYRLMDVDYIFKRGMIYTLATASVAGIYFLTVGLVVQAVGTKFPLGNFGLIAAIVVTALLFDPIKTLIQERLDKLFDRKRYDYRRTLLDFGRELGSETDLSTMLTAVVDRVANTLLVDRVAVILASQSGNELAPDRFFLAKSAGISYVGELDFSFLCDPKDRLNAPHIFFDNTRTALRESHGSQITLAQLDLNYYIPCRVQGRIIAVLGLGKTTNGDFLSSDDVELLETLSGYIAIAIQNALLYASLEQKVNEYERLKEYNENIVESINVGVLAVDLDDRIESWNAQMEVMYAAPREQARGKLLGDLFPADFMHTYHAIRNTPGVHNLYKFRLETRAGEVRIANISVAPLITREHAVVGRLIIVDDITERVSLESSVAQAEKLSSIGVLAAGVAHEVNTPLSVISSYAQMLAKQLQGDDKLSGLLDKITKQTFRASEIVNGLLNFSRTGGTEFSEVHLSKVVADTLALLEHQMKTARIKIERTGEDLPVIIGNAGKLQQVFLNLILNAKDAMPDGGILRIDTHVNGAAIVRISDTGSGIAPENLVRIFDPFFTTKNGNGASERRGTGLGLAVSYGIIQEHGGKIRVDSRVGEGTTFTLEFPMMRARKRDTVGAGVAEV
jgi:two-component system, NtrC family, sensor kinase